MISILAQERLLGAALGTALAAGVVFENRRIIYRMVSESNAEFGIQPQMQGPELEKGSRLKFAHLWNKAIDNTFKPLIASLSSRGW